MAVCVALLIASEFMPVSPANADRARFTGHRRNGGAGDLDFWSFCAIHQPRDRNHCPAISTGGMC
jgi:hypothetical protein